MKWISVEDRLPNQLPDHDVTFTMHINIIAYQPPFRPYEAVFYWNSHSGEPVPEFRSIDQGTRYGGDGFDDKVTHWMPLPEPPESDNE